MNRLTWLDVTQGLAILWIVVFHLLGTSAPSAPSPIGGGFVAEVAGAHG